CRRPKELPWATRSLAAETSAGGAHRGRLVEPFSFRFLLDSFHGLIRADQALTISPSALTAVCSPIPQTGFRFASDKIAARTFAGIVGHASINRASSSFLLEAYWKESDGNAFDDGFSAAKSVRNLGFWFSLSWFESRRGSFNIIRRH